jgi:hypothetical protein
MALRPCILCGKEIDAMGGHNTIYDSRDGKTYALCTGGCEEKGAYDDSYVYDRIHRMSEDERRRSQVK